MRSAKMKDYKKVQIEFKIAEGFAIPEENKQIFIDLFNGMALLFAQALEDNQQVPTTYTVELK